RVTEEPQVVHADLARGLGLLAAPQRRHVGARHGGVAAAGVAVGHHAVDDLDPGVGPARHGACGAEIHVVGVGVDHEDATDLGVVQHDHDLTRLCWPGG